MNLLDQFRNRLPSQITCCLCPDIQVNSRDEKISTPTHQPSNVTQTPLGLWPNHMTKEIAGHHDVLAPNGVNDFRFCDISDTPIDPFFDPRFYCHHISVSVKKLLHLNGSHPLTNLCASHFRVG